MSSPATAEPFLLVAPGPVIRARATVAAAPRNGLGFFLFILVTAVLYVRPSEVIPALLGWEIFQVLIILCLLASVSDVLAQVAGRVLEERPATACLLGLLLAVVLSHLSHLQMLDALASGYEFFKIVVYYLLLVALVTTPARLRTFLFWLTIFTAVATLLAVLDFRGTITLPRPPPPPGKMPLPPPGDPERRLVGTGIFQDPNDMCILVVAASIFCLYWLTERQAGLARFLWLGPLALFAYAFRMTQSRGGLLALLAGLGVVVRFRLGWGRTLALAALGVPLLLVALGGRQADISTQTETGQTRIQLWSDALVFFRQAPLFGIGMNTFDQMSDHVAHNSYLQAFAELGAFGGVLFLGVVYAPLAALYRLGTGGRQLLQPELRRLHPYLLGAVVAWAVGMMFLTLNYLMPTYAMAGLATAFLPMAAAWPPPPAERFDLKLLTRLAVAGVCFLLAMQVFVRLFFAG
jgi:hypothetical protein